VPSYTVGFINVYRNGVMLGTADFTATSGTTVVLAAGATAGDLVTTESFYVSGVSNAIPAVAGAVNTSYITDGAVTAVKMAASGAWAPAGTVLQVIQAETEAAVFTTSTSFVTTTLTASITPSSASNKVLVLVAAAGLNGVALSAGIYTLFRGTTAGTDLGGASNYGFSLVYGNNSVIGGAISINYLDSPSTTSSQTYTFAMRSSAGASISINSNAQKSTITLMEIAA